jgi:hypothetical protein
MKTNNEISSKVYDTLNENIKNDVIFYNIWDIKILENTKDFVKIAIVLRIPEWYESTWVSDKILSVLSKKFNKEVILNLEIIRFITIEIK